jgi:hypothetical protein
MCIEMLNIFVVKYTCSIFLQQVGGEAETIQNAKNASPNNTPHSNQSLCLKASDKSEETNQTGFAENLKKLYKLSLSFAHPTTDKSEHDANVNLMQELLASTAVGCKEMQACMSTLASSNDSLETLYGAAKTECINAKAECVNLRKGQAEQSMSTFKDLLTTIQVLTNSETAVQAQASITPELLASPDAIEFLTKLAPSIKQAAFNIHRIQASYTPPSTQSNTSDVEEHFGEDPHVDMVGASQNQNCSGANTSESNPSWFDLFHENDEDPTMQGIRNSIRNAKESAPKPSRKNEYTTNMMQAHVAGENHKRSRNEYSSTSGSSTSGSSAQDEVSEDVKNSNIMMDLIRKTRKIQSKVGIP